MTPGGTVAVLAELETNSLGPWASLIQATDGNFYGTTAEGGAFGFGVVFRVSATPSGNSVIHGRLRRRQEE